MDITELRGKINEVDSSLLALFCERMRLAENIAEYKRENGLPVLDEKRERDILLAMKKKSGEYGEYAELLYREIMKLSRKRQGELLFGQIGLLGEHLSHSYSAEIHRELGISDYKLFECEKENISEFVQGEHIRGLNVTIPYKKTVMPLCNVLSEEAKAIGCVNTLIHKPDGLIYGYNTDAYGFIYAVEHSGIAVAGKKALVFGSGGAGRAVKYALKKLGAGEVITVSRSGENNYGNLERHSDAQLIVNATPVGMFPFTEGIIADLTVFSSLSGVFDLIYNPLRTNLLLSAQKAGIPCVNGLSMLVAQAKRSAELFTETEIPDSEITRITELLTRSMCNIVLTGMPGSGKSAVGLALGRMTGREVTDTDELITKAAGKAIPEIFDSEGEEAFRNYEKAAVKEATQKRGVIIVTGGGAVLNEENRSALRRTGRVYEILRDTERLEKKGRPLSEKSNLTDMLRERKKYYEAASDMLIENNKDGVEGCAAAVLADFSRQ